MNIQTAIFLFVAIIIAGVLAFVFFVADFAKENESNSCLDFLCSTAATHVGFSGSKELYSCTCDSIPSSSQDGITCFISTGNALEQGYVLQECG